MTAPVLTGDHTGIRPTVSVIIAAFSTERWEYLREAVASVAAQSSPALETIVVIDHNPDLLARARRELAAVVIPSTGPRGASGARNTGVARSRGEVLAFLDDDAVVLDAEPVPAQFVYFAARQADDRMAAPGLAAGDRFEQVGVRTVGQLQVHRQRRIEVGQHLAHDRNTVIPLRGKRAEFVLREHACVQRAVGQPTIARRATMLQAAKRGYRKITDPCLLDATLTRRASRANLSRQRER